MVRVKLNGEELGVYFVKLFGLLFIATLAIGIVFVEIDAEARTGAYTILGTIAGYLAGSKVPDQPQEKPPNNSSNTEQKPTGEGV